MRLRNSPGIPTKSAKPSTPNRPRLWPFQSVSSVLISGGVFRSDQQVSSVLLRVLCGRGFGFPMTRDVPITRSPDSCHPAPYPLCTPISTQGHPIHPRIGRGSQRFTKYQIPSTKYQVPSTKYQLSLAAKFSKNLAFHTLRCCRSIAIFFAHINSELVHGLDKSMPLKHIGFRNRSWLQCLVLTAERSKCRPVRAKKAAPRKIAAQQTSS